MVSKQTQQFTFFTLLLFCSTQHLAVDSARTRNDDFYAKPGSISPFVSSKITENPVYVTPYYVPTGVKTLHDIGIKGKGINIGIIDSRVSCNDVVFKQIHHHFHDFVHVDVNEAEDPDNCNNRATRLAGIAVAKSIFFTGVAPEATLGIYRVFGCTGPTSTSLVLQAITTAIKDQMQIIALPEIAVVDEASTELRTTMEDAARQGVIMIVAASANNFINQQYFSYKNLPVLSVGGFKQEYRLSHWFKEKTTGRRIEFMSTCSNMKYNFGKEMDIIPNKYSGELKDHLNGFKKGGIALVWYKRTEMPDLLEYAKAIGLAGLIIVDGPFKARQKCDIPLFDISIRDALFIKEGYKDNRGYKYIFAEKYGYIKDGSVTVDTAGPQNEPFIPPFYPDILAPSHKIYTTTTRKKKSEPHFSDISAAVAYVAGAVALIAEANQYSSTDIEYVKTLLQNSAVPIKHSDVYSYSPVSYQGAGMINLKKIIDSESIHVKPSSIDVGYGYTNTANIPIRILPLSTTLLSYQLFHIPAEAVLKSSHVIDMLSRTPVAALVSFPKSINLLPKQINKVAIKISPPTNIRQNEIWSYSGYIVLNPNSSFDKLPSNRATFIPYYGTVKG
ncbi:peptidase S8/S53 domain-containing protein [Syncephalis fuscata]|nr:peptidase S8/S53 domain-containing protein [Syncephalis fuscata]